MTATPLVARRGPSPRPRRRMTVDETPEQTIARHARHIAADPVLVSYHRDREARLLEAIARDFRVMGGSFAVTANTLEGLATEHRTEGLPQ